MKIFSSRAYYEQPDLSELPVHVGHAGHAGHKSFTHRVNGKLARVGAEPVTTGSLVGGLVILGLATYGLLALTGSILVTAAIVTVVIGGLLYYAYRQLPGT